MSLFSVLRIGSTEFNIINDLIGYKLLQHRCNRDEFNLVSTGSGVFNERKKEWKKAIELANATERVFKKTYINTIHINNRNTNSRQVNNNARSHSNLPVVGKKIKCVVCQTTIATDIEPFFKIPFVHMAPVTRKDSDGRRKTNAIHHF